MANEIPGILHTRPAGADLSASQFLFVVQDVNGNIVVNTTPNSPVLGVLQDKPKAGYGGCVMSTGRTKVIAGAALAFVAGGTPITNDASGRAVVATSGQYVHGTLQESSAAAGEVVSIELTRLGKL